jgi:hypothetical protein
VGSEPVHRDWDLQLGSSLRGRVERHDGRPVAGAHIAMATVEAPPTEAGHAGTECVSDDAGSFECDGLPSGEYALSLDGQRVSDPASVMLGGPGESPQPIVLHPAPAATVLVRLDSTRAARAGQFEILARSDAGTTVSAVAESDGSARFDLPFGEYAFYLGPTSTAPKDARRVTLDSAERIVELQLPTPHLLTISGSVVDTLGNPAGDLWVNAESAASDATGIPLGVPTLTNERGEFLIGGLIEGTYNIIVAERQRHVESRPIQAGAEGVSLRLTEGTGPLP